MLPTKNRRVLRHVKVWSRRGRLGVCGINRDVSGNDDEMSRFGDTNVTGGPGGQTWVRVPSSPPIPLIRVSIHLGLAIQDSYRDSYSFRIPCRSRDDWPAVTSLRPAPHPCVPRPRGRVQEP